MYNVFLVYKQIRLERNKADIRISRILSRILIFG